MNTKDIPVGVVGLGLMGSSIVTCLLMAGHPVTGIAPVPGDLQQAEKRIRHHLQQAFETGIASKPPDDFLQSLTITEDYGALKNCQLVIESTLEDPGVKQSVFAKIEAVITPDALLASNTSAIPISDLQKLTKHPRRFFGLHWMEPSHTTRFLEVICGDLSDIVLGEYLYALSYNWNKEPTLVRKDIRGFITNRLMYAMYREAFYLVENGYATVEDVDRACRNNAGYWMTLVGVFRWMDLTGIEAYRAVMKDLFPTLNNSAETPKLIDDIVESGGKGISNGKGFYSYTPEEIRLWEKVFSDFTFDIRELALKYPENVVSRQLKKDQ